MALSMDEQRVLAEIEKRLVAEDPGLAASLTSFRRPGPAAVLRSPRARIIGSLFTVLLVAMISLMVYAMIPFRGHATRGPAGKPVVPSQTQISAVGPGSPKAVAKPSSRADTTGTSESAPAGNTAGANANTGTETSTSGKAVTTPGATSGIPASGHTTASGQTQGTKAKTSDAARR